MSACAVKCNITFMPVLILSVMMVFGPVKAWATAPNAIKLSYDQSAQMLHMEIEHVSSNIDRHFIRKAVITKNGHDLRVFYFTRQDTPVMAVKDIKYSAAEGDVIEVQVFCNQGGGLREVLEVPKAEQPIDNEQEVIEWDK